MFSGRARNMDSVGPRCTYVYRTNYIRVHGMRYLNRARRTAYRAQCLPSGQPPLARCTVVLSTSPHHMPTAE